jgi:phosphonate transport system substrate-binding protein
MSSRRLIAALFLVAALAGGCGRDHGDADSGGGGRVRLAIVATQSTSASSRDWAPILKDMEASFGLPVRADFARDGPAAVGVMRSGGADVALLSNQAGLEAVRRADGEVFARVDPADGPAVSVLVVAAKSRLTLAGLLRCNRSLTLGLGGPYSTSATLAPETYVFAARGLTPGQCLRRVVSGGARANLDAVVQGRLDVAAVGLQALRAARDGSAPPADRLRIIWSSPPLPGEPMVWRRDLDPAIKEKARQFFLTYGRGVTAAAAAQRARLVQVGIGGFSAADDGHLLPAREMEAARVWLRAKAGGDRARTQAARTALDAITAERQALEARTGAPAAAQ